jgi:hypothetical protein
MRIYLLRPITLLAAQTTERPHVRQNLASNLSFGADTFLLSSSVAGDLLNRQITSEKHVEIRVDQDRD